MLRSALTALALVCSAANLFAATAARSALPEITSLAAVRALGEQEARLGFPVHVRAVVTYFDPASPDLFVQDATAGIWVGWKPDLPEPHVGQLLDLRAVTTVSNFAPELKDASWTVAGTSALPEPRHPSYEEMAGADEDSLWVSVEGTVRQAEYVHPTAHERTLWMDLVIPGGRIDAQIPWRDGWIVPAHLTGSRVRIRGVCGAEFNARDQMTGVVIYVPSLDQVSVLEAAPPEPFAQPAMPIGLLQRYGDRNPIGRRLKLAGIVTAVLPETGFYMADDSGSILIRSRQNHQFEPGDRVEALGFVQLSPARVTLEDAFSRKIASGRPLLPRGVTTEQAASGRFDSELVRIDGLVVGNSHLPNQQALSIQQNGTVFVAAYTHAPRASEIPQPGSSVSVSGVCVDETDVFGRVLSFRILTSPGGVHLLRKPSWWTLTRVLGLTGVLGAALALGFTWVLVLRRRVREQTATIRQQLAEQANLKNAAEAANRAKGEFLANVSHEIRTPMNAVLGFTELLSQTKLTEEQREYLTAVQFSARALMRQLDELLDFSRVEAGSVTLEHTEFSVRECLSRAMGLIAPDAARKSLATALEIAPQVCDRLVGDPYRLQQILLNLLNNAVKFTEAGSIRVSVSVAEATPASELLEFLVEDTGIGIPDEAQRRIFESFQQGDGSTTRKYGGTGLGLAICSRLVALFGGTIWVVSEPGFGSRFCFTARFAHALTNTAAETPAGALPGVTQ
ncbi:MAG: hypothetical protein JO270_04800 [Acidobacteriaceae bacterium]|nr:hypothetical protein [Acidobacteriaceae bacterium]